MAYITQEQKKKIHAILKATMPKDWKWSLSVRNHSTLTMTISQAPVDLVAICQKKNDEYAARRGDSAYKVNGHFEVNHYHFDESDWGYAGKVLKTALEGLHTDHYDKSDIMTDYFNVSWYVGLQVGRWDKHFVNTSV